MSNKVWFIRLAKGVHHGLPTRWPEWLWSVFLFQWGWRLLGGIDSFTGHSAWDGLAWWAPDYAWGLFACLVAMTRGGALLVNGTFSDTIYSKFSPLVRTAGALASGGIWTMVWLSASATTVPNQGGVTYLFVALLDFLTAYYVGGEAGQNLRAHGYGRRHRVE